MLKAKENLIVHQDGLVSGQHVRLRPTKLCITLLLLSLAIWIGAVNYQVNVAYAVCFWVLGLIGVAALITKRHVRLKLNAGKRLRVVWWRGEYAKQIDENQPNQFTIWQCATLSGSLKEQEWQWAIPITQRGYFPTDLFIQLATSAPFGLFQAECRVQWQSNAVAFAAPLPHHDFGVAAQSDDTQIAQYAGMHGDDIAYLKNHQKSASLQHVAWKVYAKRGELMDKVFDEPPPAMHSEKISYLDYPLGTPMEKLASLLTYRVLQADKTGTPYTLELPNLTLTPQNGLREKSLNALALM